MLVLRGSSHRPEEPDWLQSINCKTFYTSELGNLLLQLASCCICVYLVPIILWFVQYSIYLFTHKLVYICLLNICCYVIL